MRYRSDSYAARISNVAGQDQNMPVAVKLSLWFMMTCLMTFHLMALWFVAERGVLSPGVAVGALTMLAGVLLEAIADRQKQHSKAGSPDRFVEIGLFRRWRHPNYVGEILLQVGLIVAGVASIATTGDAITAIVAPLYIVILMVAEARRLDLAQKAHYAEDTAYHAYRQQSGSLFPRI
jgi:steroid 5-alpha reductase family enzyme